MNAKCSMCGKEIEIRQRNDVINDMIRCRTDYYCPRCKRSVMYEERYA